MGSLYLNKLNSEQRQALIASLLDSQDGNCFICSRTIDLSVQANSIDIDHIEPTKLNGKDGPENFAVTHESCNRAKQASDLRVARILALFDQIAESISAKNRAPNLGDILERNDGGKYELGVRVSDGLLKTSFTVSDHRKTYFFGLSPTGHRSRQPRLWRGIGGNGSVQRLNRPQNTSIGRG